MARRPSAARWPQLRAATPAVGYVAPAQSPAPQLTQEEARALLVWTNAAMREYGGPREGSHLQQAVKKLQTIVAGG